MKRIYWWYFNRDRAGGAGGAGAARGKGSRVLDLTKGKPKKMHQYQAYMHLRINDGIMEECADA